MMNWENYKKSMDSISFSSDFQERTKQLLHESCKGKENSMKINHSIRTIMATAACIAVLAVSVFAAVNLLSASQVADELREPGVAAEFQKNGEFAVQTAHIGDYDVAFEGVVSGKALSENNPQNDNGDILDERSYAVFAVSGGNVAQLINDHDATLTTLNLSLTPLVKGHEPRMVNAFTLDGGYVTFCKDGTVYFLFDTVSLEQFAGEDVYYAAFTCEGLGIPSAAEVSMAEDGTITINEGVDGALFTVDN